MGLSRLSNFLKSVKGNIIYVDPNSLDSTDSTENQGNSLTRPFKTLQRALIEAARFSYQKGVKNDRFLKTTILLYPGEHYVDNRPGWIPIDNDIYRLRSGADTSFTNEQFSFDFRSNFDVFDATNDLYKLNSVYGGVIVPRGTSIVGFDLRKTKIRPLYVPSPINDDIERSALFRVTGGCYFWQFTIFDGDPNGRVYRDYTGNKVTPNFSHHKLTVFEYADGVNNVKIDDIFNSSTASPPRNIELDRTDLEIYYEKVAIAYGPSTRDISPDPNFPPPTGVDIEPVVDEFRVVGSKGLEVGISSIRSGNGIDIGSTEITVFLDDPVDSLSVDTAIQISNVTDDDYNGQFAISEVVNDTTFKYQVPSIPLLLNPGTNGSTLNIVVDTVSSASPYVFNCSLRSVWGMCGLHADGSKATGFRSMVVAQYTGIGLQKDERAFVKYNESTGLYQDFTEIENLQKDSRSRFKPDWENFHIKGSNNAFIQLVSVFAIGFANHFLAESGGDYSVTNSNSNFGAKALVSKGFRDSAFDRDDCGYVTHIVSPREIDSNEKNVQFLPIDVTLTLSAGDNSRLYLFNETDLQDPPKNVIDGNRIGASLSDKLYVELVNNVDNEIRTYSEFITTQGTATQNPIGQKKYRVNKVSEGNDIENNILTFTEDHELTTGESVIIISDDGSIPDGLVHNRLYYVISQSTNSIKLAASRDDATSNPAIFIELNRRGGNLDIISRVTDKFPGELGHPIQYDTIRNNWYINTFADVIEGNQIYTAMNDLNGAGKIASVTPRTYFKRVPDIRSTSDKVYKLRYVLPKENSIPCRPPLEGYVLQESSNTTGLDEDVANYITFSLTDELLDNSTNQRNYRFISFASYSSDLVTIKTELPHDLRRGNVIQIYNISSSNNTDAEYNSGYNGEFVVQSVISRNQFTYSLKINPGTFSNTNGPSQRGFDTPRFIRKKYNQSYQIYRSEIIQEYVFGEQDGIYHLLVTNASNSPTVSPFQGLNFSQPIQNLYPQYDRDNPDSDPQSARTYALSNPVGQTVVNDFRRSITRETLDKFLVETSSSFEVDTISSDLTTNVGFAHTIYTKLDHNFSGVSNLTISDPGSNYIEGDYYNVNLIGTGIGSGTNATAAIRVSSIGEIDDVVVINSGSAYSPSETVGIDTTSLIGVQVNTSFDPSADQALLQVTSVKDPGNDVIRISGITSHVDSIEEYNGYYVVNSVPSGENNRINVTSVNQISSNLLSNSGIGTLPFQNAYATLVGKQYSVFTFNYDTSSGRSTIGLSTTHQFRTGSKVIVYNADNNFYNGEYTVKKESATSISIVYDQFAVAPPLGNVNDVKIVPTGFTVANQNIDKNNEFRSSRIEPFYGGVTSDLLATVSAASNSPFQVRNSVQNGLRLGDYLLVDEEIVRIQDRVNSNVFNVLRGLLGTRRQSHQQYAIVRKINPKPVETRRNSIIRASGHTFEYLGFGPGNYSTSLPERQDRLLTPQEEVLSQSSRESGGAVLYTGMNSDGDLYNNNKKLTSNGQDQLFDSPIPTIAGEVPTELFAEGGYNLATPSEVTVSRSIKVEGGPESNIISEINGPLIITEKMTSTSDDGIEVKNISIRSELDVSRNIGFATETPSIAGNVSDITFNAFANKNSNLGWIYTTQDKWEKFGWVNDNLYGVDVKFEDGPTAVDFDPVSKIHFVAGSGVQFTGSNGLFPIEPDPNTGITTVQIEVSAETLNAVGIRTGTDDGFGNGEDYTSDAGPLPEGSTLTDQTPTLKFASSELGFGVNIRTLNDPANPTGIVTILYESPIFPINFGDTVVPAAYPQLGDGNPSQGQRIVFEERQTLGAGNNIANFAIGLAREGIISGDPNALWLGLPNIQGAAGETNYFSVWGGATKMFELDSDLNLTWGIPSQPTVAEVTIYGDVTANYFTSLINNSRPSNTAGLPGGGWSPFIINSDDPETNRVQHLQSDYLFVDDDDTYGSLGGRRAQSVDTFGTIPVRTTPNPSATVGDEDFFSVINGTVTNILAIGAGGTYYSASANDLTNVISNLGYTPLNRSDVDSKSPLTAFRQITDYYTTVSLSGSDVTCDFEDGPIFRYVPLTNDTFRFNLLNLPSNIQYVTDPAVDGSTTTDTNVSFNVTLLVDCTSATPQLPFDTSNIRVNGNAPSSIRWLNGNTPPTSPDSQSVYLIGFTIFRNFNANTVDLFGVWSEYPVA